jgi:hypothetical protein
MVETDREVDLRRIAAEEQKVREAAEASAVAEQQRRQAQGRIERNR